MILDIQETGVEDFGDSGRSPDDWGIKLLSHLPMRRTTTRVVFIISRVFRSSKFQEAATGEL
jgi:hypothetical protein